MIFDLDGTIIRSEIDLPGMKRRMIRVLEANDIPPGLLTPNQTTVDILIKAEEIWRENDKPENEIEEIHKVIEEIMNHAELTAIPMINEVEGATKTLIKLKMKGLRLAVLTRSHRAYAVEVLKKIGAYEHFDLILGRGETPRPKPYPEALQHTAKLLGLSLREVCFVGDHQIDASAASNAGCLFIGVRTGPRGDDSWTRGEPEILLDSIRDLPDLLEKL